MDGTTSLMCNSFLCRLCGENNENATNLFPTKENDTDLSLLINKYLPITVENDKKLPTKICPGCNIQLEATKLFMDLIIAGQKKIRELYKQEQEKLQRQEKQRLELEKALKNVNPESSVDTYTIQSFETGEKFLIQIFSPGPLFPPNHELSLKAEGLEKPRRKRGRPPKQPVAEILENNEVLQKNEQSKEALNENQQSKQADDIENHDGKRRRRVKIPTRYNGAIQGKELDKVFKQVGVIDEESSESECSNAEDDSNKKFEEVIGRMVDANGDNLGQPVMVNKNLNKQRSRRKINVTQSRKRRRYSCEICGREFLHHGRYLVHKKMHVIEYKCVQEGCDFKTIELGILEQHQKEQKHIGKSASERIDEIGRLQLPDVKSSNTSEMNGLKSNENGNDNPKKEFTCENCNRDFSCKQNYEVHIRAVHNGERPFVCERCDKRFSHAKTLRLHLLMHNRKSEDNSAFIYRCSACPKTFRHPSSLQYHRDSEHADGRRFICNKCDKPFKHRQLLQRHQIVHTEERPHRCPQCTSAFKTRANLRHHIITVHDCLKRLWCNLCGKAFGHKTALKLHQRWHSGIRPYQCDVCGKAFSQKGNLAEHKRIHTGEKPYQCDNCGRAFTTSSQFRLHRKRHFGERPYNCDYCARSFTNKETLRYHIRRHLNERPFRCQYCSKTFSERWALKKHERIHTGEKPYKCEICSKSFADNSNLSKHRRIHRSPKTDKSVFLVTYKPNEIQNPTQTKSTIVHYVSSEDSIIQTSQLINAPDETPIEFQQFVDQDGNPITFTTNDGQQVKVVTSNQNGQENIQGLLSDGTLIPIHLTTVNDKNNKTTLIDDSLQKIQDVSLDTPLLATNIHFLAEDAIKVGNNIQFVTADNQNMCLVAYNIDDSLNTQYLTMS